MTSLIGILQPALQIPNFRHQRDSKVCDLSATLMPSLIPERNIAMRGEVVRMKCIVDEIIFLTILSSLNRNSSLEVVVEFCFHSGMLSDAYYTA